MRSLLWEQEDPKLAELQVKEGDTEVKKKRNAVSRLAKQKGYKLSYWQTANRNARTVYTTYGVFPRDIKRPVSFENCEYTKGFTGHAGKTSTTRGSEFKALEGIEAWLNEFPDYVEGENETQDVEQWGFDDPDYKNPSDTGNVPRSYRHEPEQSTSEIPPVGIKSSLNKQQNNDRNIQVEKEWDEEDDLFKESKQISEAREATTGDWIVAGSEEVHDYDTIYPEWLEAVKDPFSDLFDYTEMAGTTKEEIMEWGERMGFEFHSDDSPFGGYFDTMGEEFTGAWAAPQYLIMIPNAPEHSSDGPFHNERIDDVQRPLTRESIVPKIKKVLSEALISK